MNPAQTNEMTTILLVDNDLEQALALQQRLNEYNYRVYTADTPESAQQFIATKKIEAILLVLRPLSAEPDRFIAALKSQK